jgi:predicted DCC family thiol-disulfide oxidoreductase YuxK
MFKNSPGSLETLTVLYDSACGFCVSCRAWLERQPGDLDLEFLPIQSAAAKSLFPARPPGDSADELIVVGSDGSVYRDSDAWIMCLYALREYREWAIRLSSPTLRPLARQAFAFVSHNRRRLSRKVGLLPETEVAERLRRNFAPACDRTPAASSSGSGRPYHAVEAVTLAVLLGILGFLMIRRTPSISAFFRRPQPLAAAADSASALRLEGGPPASEQTHQIVSKEALMEYILWTYFSYLAISIALTVWVARTLHKNGRVFLVDTFAGSEPLADSVNRLLVVGFYLINIGYVALALKEPNKPANAASSLELLSSKVGLVLLVLGGMHFFNLYVFARIRRRALLRNAPPPVRPQGIPVPPEGARPAFRPPGDGSAGDRA